MNYRRFSLSWFTACSRPRAAVWPLLLVAALIGPAGVAHGQSLVLLQRIELPAVKGRLDHLAFDVDEGRLFVAALAADSVEVVDVVGGRWKGRIAGSRGPQGVVYVHKWIVSSSPTDRMDVSTHSAMQRHER